MDIYNLFRNMNFVASFEADDHFLEEDEGSRLVSLTANGKLVALIDLLPGDYIKVKRGE